MTVQGMMWGKRIVIFLAGTLCLCNGARAFVAPAVRLPAGRELGRVPLSIRARVGRIGLGLRMSASIPSQDAMAASGQEYLEGIEKVKKANPTLGPLLQGLREQKFFRYYAVDLLSSCTYFPTVEYPCEMEKCDVENAEDVPESFRERDQREHNFRLDGWVRWDMPGETSHRERAVCLMFLSRFVF